MNNLNTAFRDIAYDTTSSILDNEPLALREDQGLPTIQRASWNGHEVAVLSEKEAQASHKVIVDAFAAALGNSASYFSKEMREVATACGLTRSMIKQVFDKINHQAKTTISVLLQHAFLNPMSEARGKLHELSPDQLLESPDLPEEFKTDVLRRNLEIAVQPANEYIDYLNRKIFSFTTIGNSEVTNSELYGLTSLEEIEESVHAVINKTELALHLLIDAVEQEDFENNTVHDPEDVEDTENEEDENIAMPTHEERASQYFYRASIAMVDATESTANVWKAKINGNEASAERFHELAQSYENKSTYCEKIALDINGQADPLVIDNLSLAAHYLDRSTAARREAVIMANAEDEVNAAFWANIATSYEETIAYTDNGIEALNHGHPELAAHWINAAGAARLPINEKSNNNNQQMVSFLEKAAEAALISADCINNARQQFENQNNEISNFWMYASRISHCHFDYRQKIIEAVQEGNTESMDLISNRAQEAQDYTQLLINAAHLAEEDKILDARALLAQARELYPHIEPMKILQT